jgi:mono/diheme cytochrome c family protein
MKLPRLPGRPLNRRHWVALSAILGLTIAVVGLLVWWIAPTGRADWRDAAQVTAGEAVYAARCAGCHGDRLQGQPNWRERLANGRLPAPPQDESGHTWHHPDSVLFQLVSGGLTPPLAPPGYQSDMPGFRATLSDDQIWAVLAFIKSRWPARIRDHQQRITEQAGQ